MRKRTSFCLIDVFELEEASSHEQDVRVERVVEYGDVLVYVLFGVRNMKAESYLYKNADFGLAFGTVGIYDEEKVPTGTLLCPRNLYLIEDGGVGKKCEEPLSIVRVHRKKPLAISLEKAKGMKEVDLVGYKSCSIFRKECLNKKVRLVKLIGE